MKRLSRVLVIALVVAVALVGYNIAFPAGKSATSNWTFVLTHPTLLLHGIVVTGILVMAVIALIRSVRFWRATRHEECKRAGLPAANANATRSRNPQPFDTRLSRGGPGSLFPVR